jgi:hypothetical protein
MSSFPWLNSWLRSAAGLFPPHARVTATALLDLAALRPLIPLAAVFLELSQLRIILGELRGRRCHRRLSGESGTVYGMLKLRIGHDCSLQQFLRVPELVALHLLTGRC